MPSLHLPTDATKCGEVAPYTSMSGTGIPRDHASATPVREWRLPASPRDYAEQPLVVETGGWVVNTYRRPGDRSETSCAVRPRVGTVLITPSRQRKRDVQKPGRPSEIIAVWMYDAYLLPPRSDCSRQRVSRYSRSAWANSARSRSVRSPSMMCTGHAPHDRSVMAT